MSPARLMQLVCCLVVVGAFVIGSNGCKDDATTATPTPTVFTASSTSLSVAPGGNTNATLSGGTTPYSIQASPDTTIAAASISGATLSIAATASGFTSVIVKDAANATIRVSVSVTGPISPTVIIFPLVSGNNYLYGGYAINTSANGSGRLPDPANVYNTSWSLSGPLPGPNPPAGSYLIRDTTRLHLGSIDTTVTKSLIIIRNPATGSFTFFQTIGPFFRALGITPLGRQDTVRAVTVADPSVGIGGTWTALDSSYTNAGGSQVRLQILGSLEGGEQITDSTSSHTTYDVLRFRTYRNVFVGSSQVVTNATTSKLWLAKNVGPVQVLISEDTENLGHFRTMKQKSF
jgi:hypothetical protein